MLFIYYITPPPKKKAVSAVVCCEVFLTVILVQIIVLCPQNTASETSMRTKVVSYTAFSNPFDTDSLVSPQGRPLHQECRLTQHVSLSNNRKVYASMILSSTDLLKDLRNN